MKAIETNRTQFQERESFPARSETFIPTPEFSRRMLASLHNTSALNPEMSISSEQLAVQTHSPKNYKLIGERSLEERISFGFADERLSHDQQKNIWISQFEDTIHNASEFFKETEKGKDWSSLFLRVGLDTSNLTQDQVASFYTRYLTGDPTEGIKTFLADILTDPNEHTGNHDFGLVMQNLDAVHWLGTSFGQNTAKILARLSSSELQFKMGITDIFVNTDARMSDKEVDLLNFLAGERLFTNTETVEEVEETVLSTPENLTDEVSHTESESELTQHRYRDIESYFETIFNRYTVNNLKEKLHIARFGKTVNGKAVSMNEYLTSHREAVKIQTLLNRINEAPIDYQTELEEMNATLPPMEADTKFSIVIPAYRESGRIEQALSSWCEQYSEDGTPINPKDTEILVVINKPNKGNRFDNTEEVVNQFKTAHPEYASRIQVVKKAFNFPMEKAGSRRDSPVSMGLIYRYATDLALLRNMRRTGGNKENIANHVIRTGGADVIARSPHHVSRILTEFDKDSQLEQYVSLSDYPPQVYKKTPLLFLAKTTSETINDHLTNGMSHIGLGTYRSSLYAEAGGFDHRELIAEEVELSRRMRKAIVKRGKDVTGYRTKDHVINALDDPKRDLVAILSGKSITRAYEDFGQNDRVAKFKMDDFLSRPLPDEAAYTLENANTQFNGILQLFMGKFFAPEKGVYEPEATVETIHAFKSALAEIGIPSHHVHIRYEDKPFEYEDFMHDLTDTQLTIDQVRNKIAVSTSYIPPVEELNAMIENRFRNRGGDWIFPPPPVELNPAA